MHLSCEHWLFSIAWPILVGLKHLHDEVTDDILSGRRASGSPGMDVRPANEVQNIGQKPPKKKTECRELVMEAFRAVFPEGLSTLVQADPDVYAIIKDEEERQWCVTRIGVLPITSL